MSKLSFDVFKLFANANKDYFQGLFDTHDKQIKEIAANVSDPSQTTATNADYAVCAQWADGNSSSAARTGYFVAISIDNAPKVEIANSKSVIAGVSVASAAFIESYNSESDGSAAYTLVATVGLADVIDNGKCTVGHKCMPSDAGTAIPSTDGSGYLVVSRTDSTHVKIAVAPNTDAIQRLREDTLGTNLFLEDGIDLTRDNILADPTKQGSVLDIAYNNRDRLTKIEKILEVYGLKL